MVDLRTRDDYRQEISTGVVLVDFYAEWCLPCQRLMVLFDRMEHSSDIDCKILKVDVDLHTDLVKEHGVSSVPTIMLYKDGVLLQTWTGVRTISVYRSAIVQAIDIQSPSDYLSVN